MARLRRQYASSDPTIPEWYVLQHLGPLIGVSIELHPAEVQALRGAGRAIPAPVVGTALVDTGASVTLIDEHVFHALKPTVHAYTDFKGYRDEAPIPSPVFHARLTFPGSALPPWEHTMSAAPLARKSSQQIVLLGRDFLREYRFVYDGQQGVITLETV